MSVQIIEPKRIQIPAAFKDLETRTRYHSYRGGRGGAKSWAIARKLATLGATQRLRILCTRELQSSIKDSVHRLLSDQIDKIGFGNDYKIYRDTIVSNIGTEFIFKGLKHNVQEIKSLEGIDICWVEEAQSTSEDSWSILIPTIRTGANWEESEIWLTWNTGKIDDPTYKRFVTNPPDDCITKKVGWQDNPFFPKVLEKERLYLQRVDIDAYNHIWEGEPLSISEAAIFKGKYVVEEFEAPKNTIFYYGADFGFAQDPSTLIRSYIQDNHLFIDYEAYGVGVETDELPQLYDSVPGSREWKIKGDRARPDTISYLKRHGFDIVAYTTKKIQKTPKLHEKTMAGDQVFIKEGLSYLKRFEKIHIHQRCRHAIDEFKLYSYKTDPQTNEILPIIVDKHNHIIDALRYSHDRRIHGGVDWTNFIGD